MMEAYSRAANLYFHSMHVILIVATCGTFLNVGDPVLTMQRDDDFLQTRC
jgi:hypothetical protein